MKVRVGGLIFDSYETPIMIKLEESEKEDIKNMRDEDTKYCVFPEECSEEYIKKFMEAL
jgi:hypothetical protein